MTAKITKVGKEQYIVKLTFDLFLSTTNAEDAGKREANFKLDGFSGGRVYSLHCICQLSVKRMGFLLQPSMGELRLLLKKESAGMQLPYGNLGKRGKSQLSCAHAIINNGLKYTFTECKERSESCEAVLPDVDSLLDGTFALTGKLDITLSLEFSGTVGEENALVHFKDIFVKQIRCDVKFKFQNGEVIGAHVPILMVRSPVFGAMFAHDTKEAQSHEVEISDIQPEVFKQLLHYVYCGQLMEDSLSEQAARSLIVAADKYQLEDLVCECSALIAFHLKTSNAVESLIWSDKFSIQPVKEATLNFIARHSKEICYSVEWEQLTINYPELCLLATKQIIENFHRDCEFISKRI